MLESGRLSTTARPEEANMLLLVIGDFVHDGLLSGSETGDFCATGDGACAGSSVCCGKAGAGGCAQVELCFKVAEG